MLCRLEFRWIFWKYKFRIKGSLGYQWACYSDLFRLLSPLLYFVFAPWGRLYYVSTTLQQAERDIGSETYCLIHTLHDPFLYSVALGSFKQSTIDIMHINAEASYFLLALMSSVCRGASFSKKMTLWSQSHWKTARRRWLDGNFPEGAKTLVMGESLDACG